MLDSTTLISSHLLRVVSDLRAAGRTGARGELLDGLETYARRARFPRNVTHPQGRARPRDVRGGFVGGASSAPVFVDGGGTACAVGHLMRLSGAAALASALADRGNHRFVSEFDEPEVLSWAIATGFTGPELARIQPAYNFPPVVPDVHHLQAYVMLEGSSLTSPAQVGHLVTLLERVQTCLGKRSVEGQGTLTVDVHGPPADQDPWPVRVWADPEVRDVVACTWPGWSPALSDGPLRAVLVLRPFATEVPGSYTLDPQRTRADPRLPSGDQVEALVGARRGPPPPGDAWLDPSRSMWLDLAHVDYSIDGIRSGPSPSQEASRRYYALSALSSLTQLDLCARRPGGLPTRGTLRFHTATRNATIEAPGATSELVACLAASPGGSTVDGVAVLPFAIGVTSPGPDWWPAAERVPASADLVVRFNDVPPPPPAPPPSLPASVRPEWDPPTFEPNIRRAVERLGATVEQVDCSDFPCVVVFVLSGEDAEAKVDVFREHLDPSLFPDADSEIATQVVPDGLRVVMVVGPDAWVTGLGAYGRFGPYLRR